MAIFSVQMKIHSRDDVSQQFPGLNNCVTHNRKPRVEKRVYGKKKYVTYVLMCQNDDCLRCTDEEKKVVEIWNKWNPAPSK